jgi:hypothetical protein
MLDIREADVNITRLKKQILILLRDYSNNMDALCKAMYAFNSIREDVDVELVDKYPIWCEKLEDWISHASEILHNNNIDWYNIEGDKRLKQSLLNINPSNQYCGCSQ